MVSIVLLVTMLLLPSQAAAPDALESEFLAAEAKSCATTMDISDVLASPEFAAAYSAFAREPGFVDLLLGHDGVAFQATAVFDASALTTALPGAPVSILGIPIRVIGETFQTLDAPADPIEAAASPPLIPVACSAELRPGHRMTSPAGCTFSHVYRDQHGRWYISTAGHCATQNGARVSAAGPAAQFGTVVYTINAGVGSDFALVRIDQDKEHLVNPAMCHWGGPTALPGGTTSTVHHYGHGTGFGSTVYTRPRTGTLSFTGVSSFTFTGAAIFGDSGSGAIYQTGPALGTITHIGVSTGNVFGTTPSRGMNLVQEHTSLQITLQTAPLA